MMRMQKSRRRALSAREKRLAIYIAVALAVVAVEKVRRWWTPNFRVQTTHYIVHSTATPQQPPARPFQIKLFKD